MKELTAWPEGLAPPLPAAHEMPPPRNTEWNRDAAARGDGLRRIQLPGETGYPECYWLGRWESTQNAASEAGGELGRLLLARELKTSQAAAAQETGRGPRTLLPREIVCSYTVIEDNVCHQVM